MRCEFWGRMLRLFHVPSELYIFHPVCHARVASSSTCCLLKLSALFSDLCNLSFVPTKLSTCFSVPHHPASIPIEFGRNALSFHMTFQLPRGHASPFVIHIIVASQGRLFNDFLYPIGALSALRCTILNAVIPDCHVRK